jgi:IS1 family transposase
MNRLPFEKRRQIIHMLVEGNTVRGIARRVDVSPVTVLRQLELAGMACAQFHDEKVRGVPSKRVQCDEIWSFNYCKKITLKTAKAAPEGAGDVWTWTAIDADSKLIVSYLVGNRDRECARDFMDDLGDRLANRVQLTTDGFSAYRNAVDMTFGNNVDFAQLIKLYSATPDVGPAKKYSPGICTGTRKVPVYGLPDRAHVSTSYVESHNQKMRQNMRRFTRLTAGHSKKFANHVHMVSLYTVWFNFVKVSTTTKVSPAMASGIETRLWDMTDLAKLVESHEDSLKVRA